MIRKHTAVRPTVLKMHVPKAEGIARGDEIADLKAKLRAADGEIDELKKKLPETDTYKMTVPELRAHLAFNDIAFDSKKDNKEDLVTLAKAAA